jgi:diguanylate cyclase (GGDEF)-like protein
MEMDARGTWLCPTPFDRERLIDMERRLAPSRALMYGSLGVGTAAGIPWLGWWILFPLIFVAVSYPLLLQPWIARSPRPEYPIALAIINAQLMLGVTVALTGGPWSPVLPMLLLAVVTLPARFTTRGVIAGALFTVAVLLASSAGVDPRGYVDDPTLVNACIFCVAGLTACAYALMRSEVQQRAHAILDPLTGLLNRKALTDRFAELREQALLTDSWVALVACDLDHFKAVNDEHGHDRGDAVLKEAAYILRKNLRSFELVYRLGGEEFLVVLPGTGLSDAKEIAERVRLSMEESRPGGLPVTVSMGVAAARGDDVSFKPLFSRADEALYEAKRSGRNRVATLEPEELAAAV